MTFFILVGNEKPQRRGSVGSLDSGMSISFQSTSASTGSRNDTKARMANQCASGQILMQAGQHPASIMGGIFSNTRRERKISRSEESSGVGASTSSGGAYGRSTEV